LERKLGSAALAICATALLAAVSAHVAIDVLGDYLVRDDSYDHLAHGSRVLFTFVALGLAGVAGFYLFSHLCAAASSLRARVQLLRVARRHIILAIAGTLALAFLVVPTMETVDALRAGGDIDSLADAFGGSLVLGISTTIACALVWSGAVLGLAAWLVHHRERVVRLLSAFLHVKHGHVPCAHERGVPVALLASAPSRRTRHRSKRGPPATGSALPIY
jgi:hypothetical protein